MERKGCKKCMERGSYEVLLWIGLFASRLLGSTNETQESWEHALLVVLSSCWSKAMNDICRPLGHKSLWIPSDAWTGNVYDSVRYRDVSSLVHLHFGKFSSFFLSFFLTARYCATLDSFLGHKWDFSSSWEWHVPREILKGRHPNKGINDLICKAHLLCDQSKPFAYGWIATNWKLTFILTKFCERSNI